MVLRASFAMIIFLYGEDEFRSLRKISEIKEKFLEKNRENFALDVFDLTEEKKDLSAITMSASSEGLFSKKRLVIAKNLIASRLAAENDAFISFLKEKAKENSKDLILVFWEGKKIDKRDKIYKLLLKIAKSQEFGSLEGVKLLNWIKEEVDSRSGGKVKINAKAIAKLEVYVGSNLYLMSNEIEKLVDYVSQGEISEDNIDRLVKAKIESDVFRTVDALARRDKKEALRLLHNHLSSGDDPFYILSMFFYQFRNLVKVKPLLDKGFTQKDIAGMLKIHPFVARKSLEQGAGFSWEGLKNLYQQLCNMDFEVKTGKIDIELALDKFIAAV